MMDSQTLQHLNNIDERSWGVIYKTLVLYASKKLNKAGFAIKSEKDSVDAEHFATLAIEKVLTGVRKWDFKRYPDITHHLIWVVKSLISSHFKSSSRSIVRTSKHSELLVDNSESDGYDEFSDDYIEHNNIPDVILIKNELWLEIEEAFGENKDDHMVFCEWLDGNPRRNIAKELDIPINDINNSIKRGLRIVKRIFANHER